jgi:hypothetical protein
MATISHSVSVACARRALSRIHRVFYVGVSYLRAFFLNIDTLQKESKKKKRHTERQDRTHRERAAKKTLSLSLSLFVVAAM